MKNWLHFEFHPHGSIWIFHFKNPRFGNSFSLACAKELSEINKMISKKRPAAVIITSHEKTFCSGGNLKDYAQLKKKSDGIKINKFIAKTFEDFNKLPVPTICILRGDCFGGGLEWLSCFDRVISAPHVFLGMWQRKVGLSWGWGGGHRLKLRIGKARLSQLLQNSETVSAQMALSIGLIDEIHPESFLDSAAISWIQQQIQLPKIPFEQIKKSNLKHEAKLFEKLWGNKEHISILNQFISKK